MIIFNVLPLREFRSPKSQFAKCQCLCIINVLSCIINVFSLEKGGKPYSKVSLLSEACSGRERSEIPADYADSAQFAHNIRELHKFSTNC